MLPGERQDALDANGRRAVVNGPVAECVHLGTQAVFPKLTVAKPYVRTYVVVLSRSKKAGGHDFVYASRSSKAWETRGTKRRLGNLPQTPTQVVTFSKPSDAGREEHCNALLSLQVAVACVCESVSEREI